VAKEYKSLAIGFNLHPHLKRRKVARDDDAVSLQRTPSAQPFDTHAQRRDFMSYMFNTLPTGGGGWIQVGEGFSQVAVQSLGNGWGLQPGGQPEQFTLGAWQTIPAPEDGTLSSIAVGADGSVMAISTPTVPVPNAIVAWNGDGWTTVSVPQILISIKQLSVASASQLWAIDNSSNSVWQLTGGTWSKMGASAGIQFANVSGATDGTVWAVDQSGNAYKWGDSNWQQVNASGPQNPFLQIAVASEVQVWAIDTINSVWQWTGSAWLSVPGQLANIDVAQDGTLWGVDPNGLVYYYTQGALIISSARLGARDLDQDDSAPYEFQVTNNTSNTILKLQLTPIYDKTVWSANGVKVKPANRAIPWLAPGQTQTVTFKLSTTQNATIGTYGFTGVQALYLIDAPITDFIDGENGWMTFKVQSS
jgi:hypothetical protein